MSVSSRPDESMDPTQPLEPDQSLSDLLSRMTTDIGNLVSTQIELAKVEIKEEVGRAGKGVGMLGGGGLAGYFAALMISFAIAYGLGDAFDNVWIGFLLVGIVYAIAAAVLIQKGKEQVKTATPVAEQTVETLKEDLEWARQQKS